MKKLNLMLLLLVMSKLSIGQNTYEIYISDAGGFNSPSPPWQILKYDQNGENGEVFISENLGWPQDILFLELQNQVLISNLNTDSINIHNATTGEFIGLFGSQVDGPTRMAFGLDGLIYVLQWNGVGGVHRYTPDGVYLGQFNDVNVPRAIGLDWDDEQNLYVSSYNQSTVRSFDSEGNNNGLFISSGLNGPTNIWFNEEGELLVNNYNLGNVLKFDSNGGFIETLITGIGQCEGIAVLPNGDYLIGGRQTGVVNQYNPDGTFVEELISSEPPINLSTPNAVVRRDIVPLNTAQNEAAEIDMTISPIPGDYFNLETDKKADLERVEVFNDVGQKVFQKAYTGDVLWDGRSFPEGQYSISLHFKGGDSLSRKVILKHQ